MPLAYQSIAPRLLDTAEPPLEAAILAVLQSLRIFHFPLFTLLMPVINLDEVKPVVFACLRESLRRIEAEGLKNVTSMAVTFDANDGAIYLSLNEDDDESFVCEETASYTRRGWSRAWLGPVRAIVEEHQASLDSFWDDDLADDDLEKITLLLDGVSHRCEDTADYYKRFFEAGVGWVKTFFENLAPGAWRPAWLLVQESNCYAGSQWACPGAPPLPPSPDPATEPLTIVGFPPPKNGLKVFQVVHTERKYAGLHSSGDLMFLLRGKSCRGDFASPRQIEIFAQNKRVGSLACPTPRELALLKSAPQFQEAVNFLAPWVVEFLPLCAAEHSWQMVHPLDPIAVLDPLATNFSTHGFRIEHCEFDPQRLRQSGRPIFRVAEAPNAGSFFLETGQGESFLQFCQRTGLRGVEFALVWCEDLSLIEAQLEEFLQLADSRLKRRGLEPDPAAWAEIECLSGIQLEIWSIGKFRRLLQSVGAAAAAKQVPLWGRLALPYVRKSPHSTIFFHDQKKNALLVKELIPILEGREILNDLRGYFCRYLPGALRDLKRMEATNSGDLAAYGPSV